MFSFLNQVHEIQWLDEVEKMTKDDIKTLVQDPNVMAVTSNMDSYSQNRKKKHAINVTGKTNEALHLLDESMIQELEDIRTAIKEKEAENEKLNAILEETQERMFGLRDEHDALVHQAEAAKQAAAAAQKARNGGNFPVPGCLQARVGNECARWRARGISRDGAGGRGATRPSAARPGAAAVGRSGIGPCSGVRPRPTGTRGSRFLVRTLRDRALLLS